MPRHEIRVDLSGTDLAALHTEGDVRQEARRLLPAALEELGRALAEAAWAGVLERSPGPPAGRPAAVDDRHAFLVEAGRRYRRHAPAGDRAALEEVIVQQLRASRAQASAGTRDGGGGSTVTAAGARAGPAGPSSPDPCPFPGPRMRTLEYTLPDGTGATATPDDVARAVEALLMDGTMVMDSKELAARLDQLRAEEARFTAIVRAIVARAAERDIT